MGTVQKSWFSENKSRLPGSVLSDASLPAHTAAIQEDAEYTAEEFRTQLKLREVARKAFPHSWQQRCTKESNASPVVSIQRTVQ